MFTLCKIENVKLDNDGNFFFDVGVLWDSNEGEEVFTGDLHVYKNGTQMDNSSIIMYDMYDKDGLKYNSYYTANIKTVDYIKIVYSFEGQEDAIDLYLNEHNLFDVCSCDLKVATYVWVGDIIKMKIEALNMYSDELCCNCEIPVNFLNRVIQITALEYAVQSEDTALIDELMCIVTGNNTTTKGKGCGCHGN